MQESADIELLRQYAGTGSEEAFAALVARHVNLVYSVALRKTGNPHAAEEITQAVFVILARKAADIREGTILTGWLYQTARLTAGHFMRTEIRRLNREQEAYMRASSHDPGPEIWAEISPLLEDAMAGLGEPDRNALLLRYFEGKSFHEIGTALGASENAAKKRVAYALEKLRRFFSKRGVKSTTVIIAGALSAHSVQAAPAALAKSITTVAMTKGVATGGSTSTLIKGALKIMAWTKMKTAVVVGVGVLLTAGGGTGIYALREKLHLGVDNFPRSMWSSRGSATPEAALVSELWSKSRGDSKAFLASSTPEMAQQLEEILFKNKSDRARSAAVIESIKQIKGLRIRKKTVLPDGQVVLELNFDGLPKETYSFNTMTNIGGEWKMSSVEEHFAGSYIRLPALEPELIPEHKSCPALAEDEFAPRAGSILQGFWTGVIGAGNDALNVSVKIAEPSSGTFRADFYSVDQGSIRQPTTVSYDGTTIKLVPMSGLGMFQGELRDGGAKMAGNWIQNGHRVPTTFARAK